MSVELSIVVATLRDRDEIELTDALDRCAFDDYELLLQDEEPVTRARNAGAARASSEKIVYLDDDSRVTEGYLSRAAETLGEEPAYAGRTVHPRDDIFAEQFTGHYSFGDEPRYVDRFWGCNMGIRREILEAVGGWDENIGWGHEEKELARRVAAEFDIYYDPELVVYHPYADSLLDFWWKQYELELQAPYCWEKKGASTGQMVRRIVGDAVTPTGYVGRTPTVALARGGRTVMKTIGRVTGLLALRTRGRAPER